MLHQSPQDGGKTKCLTRNFTAVHLASVLYSVLHQISVYPKKKLQKWKEKKKLFQITTCQVYRWLRHNCWQVNQAYLVVRDFIYQGVHVKLQHVLSEILLWPDLLSEVIKTASTTLLETAANIRFISCIFFFFNSIRTNKRVYFYYWFWQICTYWLVGWQFDNWTC